YDSTRTILGLTLLRKERESSTIKFGSTALGHNENVIVFVSIGVTKSSSYNIISAPLKVRQNEIGCSSINAELPIHVFWINVGIRSKLECFIDNASKIRCK